jgi:CheY-like chemotaxis protein
MPVLDGWEFLDEISSANEANLENTSLYILSSSTDESDIEKAKQYHLVREFYHKPLSEEDINEILAFH